MARGKAKAKIKNPLSPSECKLLKDLAKFAKDNELLEGVDRKRLFQAGQFPTWFSTNFTSLPENLNDIIDDLDGTEEFPTVDEVVAIRNKIINTGNEYGIARDGGETSKTELALLQEEYLKGELDPPDRLKLAELYEEAEKIREALEVATVLLKEFPENEDVKFLVTRLEKSSKEDN